MKSEYRPLQILERLRSPTGVFVKMLPLEEEQERTRSLGRLKYKNNRLKILASQKEYYRKNSNKIKARTKAYSSTEKGRVVQAESVKRYLQNNRLKHNARSAVSRAVKDGRLIKLPCVKCGNKKSQAHHPDYNKPLDVVWLCLPCHWEEHV